MEHVPYRTVRNSIGCVSLGSYSNWQGFLRCAIMVNDTEPLASWLPTIRTCEGAHIDMSVNRIPKVLLTLSAALVLIALACGGGESAEEPDDAAPAASAPTALAPAAAAAPAPAAAPVGLCGTVGGEISEIWLQDPDGWGTTDGKPPEADFKLTAVQYWFPYNKDESKADAKFRDKCVQLSGAMEVVSEDSELGYVVIRGANPKQLVKCSFDPQTMPDNLSRYRTRYVKVLGLGDGKSEGYVHLRRCSIVEIHTKSGV